MPAGLVLDGDALSVDAVLAGQSLGGIAAKDERHYLVSGDSVVPGSDAGARRLFDVVEVVERYTIGRPVRKNARLDHDPGAMKSVVGLESIEDSEVAA